MDTKHPGFLHLRVGPDVIRLLDELRRHEDDVPNRTEMVKRMIVRLGAKYVQGEAKRK